MTILIVQTSKFVARDNVVRTKAVELTKIVGPISGVLMLSVLMSPVALIWIVSRASFARTRANVLTLWNVVEIPTVRVVNYVLQILACLAQSAEPTQTVQMGSNAKQIDVSRHQNVELTLIAPITLSALITCVSSGLAAEMIRIVSLVSDV